MAYTTIDNPGLYFNTLLYAGSASTWVAHTGVGFSPDMTWHKSRTSTGWHGIADRVRGVDADPGCKAIYSNSTSAEETSTSEYLDGYQSDGFTTGVNGSFGAPSQNYVAWCWKAGGSASAHTDGTIDTSRSANTTAGFSIATYTGNATNGATRGHGLGVVPHMVVVKNLTDAVKWYVYHHKNTAAPETEYLSLDSTAATTDQAGWNDTAPTSTLVTTSDGSEVNASGKSYAMYSWTGIQGYSKFGSYVGNGGTGTSGPFVYTGFRPALVMIKKTSAVGSWFIFDNKRASTANVPEGTTGVNSYLEPNTSGTEQGDNPIFLLSNGFQCLDSLTNTSGATYVYIAFAEAPFVNSNGVPCNAR